MQTIHDMLSLPRQIYILFLARFINYCGSFVLPFATLYLTAHQGVSSASAGMVVGTLQLMLLPGALIGGKLADKFGRKSTLLFGNILAALAIIPATFSDNTTIIIGAMLLMRFFQGAVQPASDGMIADLVPPERRQIAYSLSYMAINLGGAVGLMSGGLLFVYAPKLVFPINAVSLLLMALIVGLGLRETLCTSTHTCPSAGDERASEYSLIKTFAMRPKLIILTAIIILLNFGMSQCMFLMPLELTRIYGVSGAEYFGYLMTINTLMCGFLTSFSVSFTKRLGEVGNIALSSVLFAIGFAMYGISYSPQWLALAIVVWTSGEILMYANAAAFIANHAPSTHRGRLSGAIWSGGTIGFWLGPTVSGHLAGVMPVNIIWFIIGAVCCCALFLTPALNNDHPGR